MTYYKASVASSGFASTRWAKTNGTFGHIVSKMLLFAVTTVMVWKQSHTQGWLQLAATESQPCWCPTARVLLLKHTIGSSHTHSNYILQTSVKEIYKKSLELDILQFRAFNWARSWTTGDQYSDKEGARDIYNMVWDFKVHSMFSSTVFGHDCKLLTDSQSAVL